VLERHLTPDRPLAVQACAWIARLAFEPGPLTPEAIAVLVATMRDAAACTALARVGGRVALGHQDGNIELRAPGMPSVVLERAPSSPVASGATLVAGFASGVVGMWSVEGKLLETFRLHGPVRFLELRGKVLHAVTELGDHEAIDVGHYLESYCAVLRGIWSEVPVIWDEGRVQLRPPPAAHPCATR
jgi:hypothetical protein